MKLWFGAPLALAVACQAPITYVGEYHDIQIVDGGPRSPDAAPAPSIDDAAPPLPDRAPPFHDAALPPPVVEGGTDGFYLEAEDGALTDGFTAATDPGASGGKYIVTATGTASNDVPGPARATYRVTLQAAGNYLIWGRIHSPDVARNAFWVRVDEERWYVWRLSTGEDWYWGTFHDNVQYSIPIVFTLAAGSHDIQVANFVDGVSLDRLYVTTGKELPAGNDTPCHPPDSIRLGGTCVNSCGSQGGTTCGDVVCSGRVPIPAYDCAVCCIGSAMP